MRVFLAGLAFLLLIGGLTYAPAQDSDRRREGMRQMMPPGGGAMVVHKDHIYVLTGSRLVKVNPDTMEIAGELELGKPPTDQPRRPPEEDGQDKDK